MEGWIFGVWLTLTIYISLTWLYQNNPQLLAERFRQPGTGGQSQKDEILSYFLGVGMLLWLILMCLDGKRFSWTSNSSTTIAITRLMPSSVSIRIYASIIKAIIGVVFMLTSSIFVFRAFADNPYLSPLVRIQKEREHRVVTTGVYSIVRHPLYLGAVLMLFGAPVFLGSAFVLPLSIVMTLVFAFRAVDEEHLLITALKGYPEYKKQVKYRLVPGVW